MSSNSEWSNSKKWWMDLLKSVISFFLIAVFTMFIINDYNAKVDETKSLFRHNLAKIEQTAEILEKSMVNYYGSAYGAYSEKDKAVKDGSFNIKKPPNVVKYEDDSFDQIKFALGAVEENYPEFVNSINEWKNKNSEMHDVYSKLSGFLEFNNLRNESREIASMIVKGLRIKHQSCWSYFIENPNGKAIPDSCITKT